MKTLQGFATLLASLLGLANAIVVAQVSTSSRDECSGVSTNATGTVVVGFTAGSLFGATAGAIDTFVKKYAPDGTVQWKRQFGSSGSDFGLDVTMDALGNSFVVGVTDGALTTSLGGKDGFLRKYDSAGNVVWTRQFGTTSDDSIVEVAVDHLGNMFVLSQENLTLANPGFVLRRYSAAGASLQRVRISDRNELMPRGLAVDSVGNVLVLADWVDATGTTGQNIRVYKYSGTLTPIWQKAYQTNPDWDQAFDIATSGSDIFFTAHYGTFGARLVKMNEAGAIQWARSLEPPAATRTATFPESVATDNFGNVFVTGSNIDESYSGFHSAGSYDVIAFKYDSLGNRKWVTQLGDGNHGTDLMDAGLAISASDIVFVVGVTWGDMQLNLERLLPNEDGFVAGLDTGTGQLLGIDQYVPTTP